MPTPGVSFNVSHPTHGVLHQGFVDSVEQVALADYQNSGGWYTKYLLEEQILTLGLKDYIHRFLTPLIILLHILMHPMIPLVIWF